MKFLGKNLMLVQNLVQKFRIKWRKIRT